MEVSVPSFDAASSAPSQPSPSLLNQIKARRQSHRRSRSASLSLSSSAQPPTKIFRLPSYHHNSTASASGAHDYYDHSLTTPPRHSRTYTTTTYAPLHRTSASLDPTQSVRPPSSGVGPGPGPGASPAPGDDHFALRSSIHRWSHSTSSSIASLASSSNTRRNRSSSGAVLTSLVGQQYHSPRRPQNIDASPRPSPQRRNLSATHSSPASSPHRRPTAPDIAPASLTALPPLHTIPALTDSNDPDSPSTTHPSPSALTFSHSQYFDGSVAQYGTMGKQKRVVTVRTPTAPVTTSEPASEQPSPPPEMEHRSRGVVAESNKRSRHKERAGKDKKTMLSKALQKANTAVLLDNAQNYEGALEAYGDACDLLAQVMERTSGEEDKRKLDAIRVTYSNRMDELHVLVQERPPTALDKDLPERPSSDDDEGVELYAAPTSPQHDPSQDEDADFAGHSDAPRISYRHQDRDSFFTRTMAAVESSDGFAETSDRNGHGQATAGAMGTDHAPQHYVHLPPPEHAQYVPSPLLPRRPSPQPPQSPDRQDHMDNTWGDSSPEPASRTLPPASPPRSYSKQSSSWLDHDEDSESSRPGSAASPDSYHQGPRRKYLRDINGQVDPDFDEAFDAAVEAAYDEGLEPDLEARRKRITAYQHRPQESLQVPASAIEEIIPGRFQASRAEEEDEEEEEEERILDEITNDFGGRGFDFDLSSKSALPRQSDSSGYSRSTWQSSQMSSSRDTAGTSLSTVAEDGFSSRMSKSAPIRDSGALPSMAPPPIAAPPAPPVSDLPIGAGTRNRRLSSMNAKQLKIETSPPEVRKRASTFQHARSPMFEADDEDEEERRGMAGDSFGGPLDALRLAPTLETYETIDEASTGDHRPSYEETVSELRPGQKPTLFRKNKSSVSLREHVGHTVLLASPDQDAGPTLATPMSSTFMHFAAARRNPNPLTSQRAHFPSLGPLNDLQPGGGNHLFDTSLYAAEAPLSPTSLQPPALESCPEPFLLRPFWLMRALSSTISHPRGGFLTTKLFVPREVWQTRGVKLKMVEDKIANCDLLTAALGRLKGVDTYDADAVMEELQSFEEVMERVQMSLTRKLGSDVGVQGVSGMFKDAPPSTGGASTTGNTSSDAASGADKAAKSNSGKSYLTSWRKLRNKSSGAPVSGSAAVLASAKAPEIKEQHTMASVPMTSFVPVERRGNKREARNLMFDGPNREYMGSLARLFDGVQVLDQIARQVEDPGLKLSSPTHVGLELSIRHAAEFFAFYVCRFVLADINLLMEKYVKRGTEWVLA